MIKECLITVGATAKFPELIQAALSEACLQKFVDGGFTRLTFQYGDSQELFETLKAVQVKGLEIRGFGFDAAGLNKQIRACQAQNGVSVQGMVISHAGAGTILDVMRLAVPLIVVPNHTLLDNHQEELADELERQGYVTKSSTIDLANSIEKACKPATAWGSHSSNFPEIVDNVVGYDIGYEQEMRERLD